MKMKKDLNKVFSEYYIAPPIKAMLDKGKEHVLKKDWDRVYIIDGAEGAGKSLLGLQLGYYLDSTLNLDRVVFTGEQFSSAIKKANQNECIIFDEAFNGLDSGGATTKLNKLIIKNLMECRQKNLFIIIILPTIFLLKTYVAIFRSKCLFHVYATKKGVRGYYRVYNQQRKKILYIYGKKLFSYSRPHLHKSYRFYGKYPISEQAYRDKKLVSLNEEYEKERRDVFAIRFAILIKEIKKKFNMPYTEQIKLLEPYGMSLKGSYLSRLMPKIPKINL